MPADLNYLLQARRNRYAQPAGGARASSQEDPRAAVEEEAFQAEQKRLAVAAKEQAAASEDAAKAYDKGRRDAEKEALRARNNEMEAKARREKRPIYTDADGAIQSQYTDDEWEAQKERKAKNDQIKTQYFKAQRPWREDGEGNIVPRHTDEEWQTLQAEKAAKDKAKQVDEQTKAWREQKGQALTNVDDQTEQVMRGLDLEGQDLGLQHRSKLDTVKKANAQIKQMEKEIEDGETEGGQILDGAAIAKRTVARQALLAERDKVQTEAEAAEAKVRAHEVRKLEYSRANNEVQGWLQKQKHGLKTELPPVVMGVKGGGNAGAGSGQDSQNSRISGLGTETGDQNQSRQDVGAPSTEEAPSKEEAVRKAVIEGRISALAEDDSLSDEERKAGLTRLMLQRDDPKAYETQVMQEFEGMPPEKLNEALDGHLQDFDRRKQDWQARRDALREQTQAVNAEVDGVLARNKQRLLQPHKAADLIEYTTGDGGKVSVFKDLVPQLEQAQEKAGTFEKQNQAQMDQINAEGGELERAAKLIHAGGGVLQKKQETARVAAQAERQKVYEQLNALPGAKLGDDLAKVDAAVAKHQGGDDVSLHEWAAKEREKIAAKAQEVQKKVGPAVQEAYAAASAKMPAGVDLNGELDRDPLGLEGPASESGVTKLLEKMGLPSSKENREMAVKLLRDAAVLDWSRGDTSAPVRTDSAGRVLVNPERWTDDKAYAEAVAGAGASEAEKAKALEMQPELKAQAIKLKLDTLRTLGVFNDWEQAEVEPTREEKMKAEANGTTAEPRMVHAGLSDEEKLKLFEKENSGFFSTGAWKVRWNQALLGAAQGVIGLVQSATGLAAPFSDRALEMNQRLGKESAGLGAGSQALPTGQWVNQGASMLVSSAPALAVGGAVGAATRSETLALHGAAAGAGLQTFGQVYGEAVQGYMQNKGLSKAEARKAALVPALASGVSTYALTAAGGTNGMESVLRQEGFKQGLKQWLATVGKGALKESVLEEGPDQLIQGVLARHSYDPTKSWGSIWEETVTAVIGGALMGGGFEMMSGGGKGAQDSSKGMGEQGNGGAQNQRGQDGQDSGISGLGDEPVDESGPEFISRRGLEIAAQKRLEQLREKRDGRPGNEEMTLPGGIKVPATITQNGQVLSKQEETEFKFLEKQLAQDQIDHSALANAYNKKLKTIKTAGANSAAPATAATAPKSQWQRPARLDSQNRRQLEKEAEAAIDQLPEDQQADAIEKLIRLKRQHADMRAEIADADAGEARVLEADIVDVENKMRRLAGQPEVANSPPITPEDQAKERARIHQRAEEIQAKITAGEEITAGDRLDWDLAGRDVNDLPPTPAGKPTAKDAGAGQVVTPAAQEARAELASFAPEGMAAHQVAATKAKAEVLLRMAQGETLHDFTDEELRQVGLNRDGTPGHYETVPLDKRDQQGARTSVWKKGVRPDGFQPVVVEDGELIITQRQIDNLGKRLPAVAAQIGKSEVERRREIKESKTVAEGRASTPLTVVDGGLQKPKVQEPISAAEAAESGPGVASKEPAKAGTTVLPEAGGQNTLLRSPEGNREQRTEFDPAVEKRVDEIGAELAGRGLSGEQALKAARGVVGRMGVMGPKYEVQMIDPAFEEAMKAEGFQRDPAKMSRWMARGQFKAETRGEKPVMRKAEAGTKEALVSGKGMKEQGNGGVQTRGQSQLQTGAPSTEPVARAEPMPALIERSDWKQAQGEVIAGMQGRAKGLAEAGKKAAGDKIKAVVKRFNKLEELIDTKFGRLFEGVRIVPNGSLAGGGLAAQVTGYDAQGRATGVELVVDAATFAEAGGVTDAELERALNEEWQHRADLMVMSRSEAIALARDIHAAQPGVFNAAWKQYYAVGIKEGSMPAKPPVDLTDDEAYMLYFEASRMIRQGTFTSENAAIRDVGLLQRMYLMLSRYVNFVRREMKKLPQDLRDLWEDKLTAAEAVMGKTKQAGIRLQKEGLDDVEPPESAQPKKAKAEAKPKPLNEDEEAMAMAADAEMDTQPERKGALRNPGENAIRGMAAIPDPDNGKENVVVWISRYHGRITRPSKGWLARMAQDGKDRSKIGDWDDIRQAEIPSFYAGLVFKNGNGSTLDQALQELHGLGYFPGVAEEDVTGEMLARKIKDVIARYQGQKQGGATTVQDEEQAHFERMEKQRVEFERSTAKGPIYVKPHEMQPGDVMMVKADDGKMHRVEVLRLDTEAVAAGDEFDPDANPAQFMGPDGPMEIRSVTLKDGTTFGVQTIDGQQGLYVDAFSVRQEGDFYAGLSDAVQNRTIDDADAVLHVMQHEGMDATTPFSQIVLAIQQNLRVPMRRAQKMLGQVMDTAANATVWTNEELKQALESPLGSARKQAGDPMPPPFYSKLAQVIEQKMPNRADAKTIMGILTNPSSAIKAEELKWSGIVPWVQGQTGPVTKDAVLEYLRTEGAVRLEEVRMDDSTAVPADEARRYFEIAQRDWDAMTPQSRADMIQDASERKKRVHTKYSQYQLPGGENYREVVLAMPDKANRLLERLDDLQAIAHEREMTAAEDAEVRQISQELDHPKYQTPEYISNHFTNVPNYVAHMRLNDRLDASGEAGTFIEEIQSDRHQAGREKGYGMRPMWAVRDQRNLLIADDLPSEEAAMQAAKEHPGYSTSWSVYERPMKQGVPDAPFRTTWPLQMFKRALVDAVSTGKKWIGWTTGETQAERYDMSQQVDAIKYLKTGDTYTVAAEKDGQSLVEKEGLSKEQLADLVGKELAQKIVNDEGESTEDEDYPGVKQLSGDGLKVGGDGMKGFYDSILPKEIGKYVKQWGAGVVKGELPGGTPIKFKSIVEFRDALHGNSGIDDDLQRAYDAYQKKETTAAAPIWRVEITPQMRAGVEAGQALFAPRKQAGGFTAGLQEGLRAAAAGKGRGGVTQADIVQAYRAATVGESSVWQPIQRVFERLRETQPGLTPEAFMQTINALNDEGQVLISPVERLETVQAAKPFVVGAAGVEMTFPPEVVGSPPITHVMPDGFVLTEPGMNTLHSPRKRAYHGTPHKVDKFSLDKIGTGEGAQAYGWGLYFAGNKAVAQQYQKGLTERDFIRKIREEFSEHDDQETALEVIHGLDLSEGQRALIDVLAKEDWWGFDFPHQAVQAAIREPENFDPSPELLAALEKFGNLYTVDLLPEEEEFLDWDKPLSEQSEKVKVALAAFSPATRGSAIYADVTQKNVIPRFERNVEVLDYDNAQIRASKFLQSRGIPGIRYLDGNSRATGEGTHNYVLFDEKLVSIIAENGKPVEKQALASPRKQASQNQRQLATVAPSTEVDQAAHEAATSPRNDLAEPTAAQKEAGNYAMGHVTIGGHEISIENPAGSRRRAEWPVLRDHYGYLKGTLGQDGDHVDVFVKPGTPADYAGPVHVVRQNVVEPIHGRKEAQKNGKGMKEQGNGGTGERSQTGLGKSRSLELRATGKLDEYKVMLGYATAEEARAAYLRNYTPGWPGLAKLTTHTMPEFEMIKRSVFGGDAGARATDKALASPSTTDVPLEAPRKQGKALEMMAKADWGRIDKALTGRLAAAVTDAAAWIKKQALPGEAQVNPVDAALELLAGWSVEGQAAMSGVKLKPAQRQELMAQTRRQMRRFWNYGVRQLVPDASLPADVLAKKREMTMNQGLSNEVALDIGKRALAGKPKLSDLVVGEAQQNPEIRRKMFLAMNPRIDSGVTMESLNPEERRVAEALLKLRDDLGKRMVKAGRIGLQTYEAMREGTSHYYDHDVKREKNLLRQMSMGLRNLFAQTATAYHIVDTQTKQPDGSPALVMHPGSRNRPTYRFDTQEQMRGWYEEFLKDQILQAAEKGNAVRYPWMTPADKAALMGVTRDSLNNPGRMSAEQRAVVARLQEQLRARFEKRMPLSYDEHSKAGLIEDPFYSVARQIAEMGHDVATAEFFNSIAAVPDYVRDAPTIGYTEMPDTAKLGALAGKYVRDDVAAEVQQLTDLPGMGMKFYDALLGLFKTGKTVLNPGSHGRNIVGNIAFAHLAGSNPLNPGNFTYYADALRVLRDGGAEYKEMYESGVLGGDFLTGEVKRSLRQLVPDAATVLREAESGNMTWLYGLKEHMARRWQGLLKTPGKALDIAATAWRLEDDIYKAAAYLKAKGMGMTSKEAAEHVREWFPYYDKGTSGTLKALGRFAFPFLSFKRESFRILKNGLTKKPLATITTLALPRLLTQIALTMAEMRLIMWTLGLGLKDERDKEDVMKALKGRAGRLLSPIAGDTSLFSILLPWRDDNGGVQQWDLSNTHPFGDWLATRIEDAESKEPWIARQARELLTGSPFVSLLVESAFNKDSFTGRRIYEDDMSSSEATDKLLEHAFTELAPPIAPTIPLPGGVKLEGTSARTIRKAFEQSPSKLAPARNPTQAVIRAVLGLDVRPADPNLYEDVAKYREKNKLPAVPRGQQFPSDAVGRARAELYRLLIQPEVDVPAAKSQLDVLTKHGAKIPSVQDLFKDRQPQDVMELKKHQARWMNQLPPEARRVLEAAQAQQSGAYSRALDAMAKARAGG